MSLHFNAVRPCPSRERRKTHRAHGEICLRCDPDAEWMAGCPVCLDRVPAIGTAIRAHAVSGGGVDLPCPGAGSTVYPQVRAAWSWPVPDVRVHARPTAVPGRESA